MARKKLKNDAHQDLRPVYPPEFDCSPLTSLYGSWIDIDGSRRSEPHSGVDGGRLGEPIFAPAPGQIEQVWVANWGWGQEGALLIRHSKRDLNLGEGPEFYFSEFDHLDFRDIERFQVGDLVARGQQLAKVSAPGGRTEKYLPEVHWEVWAVRHPSRTVWKTNKFGKPSWENPSAQLIDPLLLLSGETSSSEAGAAPIQVFVEGQNQDSLVGFTYILPCKPRSR